jgi:hypothetical protein
MPIQIRDHTKETEHDRILFRSSIIGERQRLNEVKAVEHRKIRVIAEVVDNRKSPVFPLDGKPTLLDCFTWLENELLFWFNDEKNSTGAYRERWLRNN